MGIAAQIPLPSILLPTAQIALVLLFGETSEILRAVLVVLRHGLMFRQPGHHVCPQTLRQRFPTVGQDQRGFGLAFLVCGTSVKAKYETIINNPSRNSLREGSSERSKIGGGPRA